MKKYLKKINKENLKKVCNKENLKTVCKSIRHQKTLMAITTMFFIGCIFTVNAYAVSADTSSIDNITKWIATWVSRVGLAVAFFGGVQTAFGFKNDDADAKTRGLKTVASGFMVFALCQSLHLFGL